MPVYLETHSPELDIDPGTTKGRIIAFLYQNPQFGYKPVEIQEELKIPKGTATGTLARLHNEGYIGRTQDSFYHALKDQEELRRYAASVAQLSRLTERHSDAPSIEDATQTKPREQQLAETESPTEEAIESELAELEDAVESEGEDA